MGRGYLKADVLQEFITNLADGLDRDVVMKKMKISDATFDRYKSRIEEIVDNYSLFMIESGLILKVKASMERLENDRKEYDELLQKAKQSKNNWQVLHVLNARSAHEKNIIEMLNNGVVAKRIKNILDRIAVEGKDTHTT